MSHTLADFYAQLELIKADPNSWFIYSGNAYEIARELHGDTTEYPIFYAAIETALNEIGLKFGLQGKDKYNREIWLDWYGTSVKPSFESIEFIRSKKEQYHRVVSKLMSKRDKARAKYDKTHITKNTCAKRNKLFYRIGELDKRAIIAWNTLQKYRNGCGMEYGFDVEFSIVEKRF